MSADTPQGDLNWLLNAMLDRVVEARHVVVLSGDGLRIASSRGLLRDDAEHLSAVASGFQSLARGTAEHFAAGNVRQTIVEMDGGFLFVTAAGHGACLALLAEEGADVGVIAYEMALLVSRVGEHLSAQARVPGGR
ncbi:putative regulator of Ras-like GTPase activity (Roadblock/LC7/MglB family) [Actinocorallia herbida]|uniref:Putative regulator of Ras-like GTPase activity (Roadblock/LC7/MglB family) n=1 Tax=Actinocorallia herbida TaxID=58109 RepID=A0A3N1D7W1_9ACTN|nr:roadblock/LC7 domain-containing protein [Actinocorallia herbida]ROO89610.1 putative regulator of Ras-like GTPase activity (Roadblock/LC7/MglB family) [Actinocorallia herbida]